MRPTGINSVRSIAVSYPFMTTFSDFFEPNVGIGVFTTEGNLGMLLGLLLLLFSLSRC